MAISIHIRRMGGHKVQIGGSLLDAIHSMDGQPPLVPSEGSHGARYLPVFIPGRSGRDRTRVLDVYLGLGTNAKIARVNSR